MTDVVSKAVRSRMMSGIQGRNTKLDDTAKGGMLFAIAEKLRIPIRFIGVGEAMEDLREFHAREFVDALLDRQ